MRKLILKMAMTLDGFVAGPNGEADWLFRTGDEEVRAWTVEMISRAGIHAMGHKTWLAMATHWPTSKTPFAPPMNDIPKVVFTRAGLEGSPALDLAEARAHKVDPDVVRGWEQPRIAAGSIVDEVAALKRETGGEIIAHGGAMFARSLIEHDLVDEYALAIHPVVLGRGLPIFTAARPMDLELVDVKRFPKGTVAHVYRRSRS